MKKFQLLLVCFDWLIICFMFYVNILDLLIVWEKATTTSKFITLVGQFFVAKRISLSFVFYIVREEYWRKGYESCWGDILYFSFLLKIVFFFFRDNFYSFESLRPNKIAIHGLLCNRSRHKLIIFLFKVFAQRFHFRWEEAIGESGLMVESTPGLRLKGSSWLLSLFAREWISPASVSFILHSLVEESHLYSDILNTFTFFISPRCQHMTHWQKGRSWI